MPRELSAKGGVDPLNTTAEARMAHHDMSWELDILPTEWIGMRSRFDRQTWRYLGISAVSHLTLLMIIMTMPERSRSLELDAHFQNDRFVQALFEPEQEPEDLVEHGVGEVADSSAKHAGEEGKAGTEDSDDVGKRLAIKGEREPEDLQLRKIRDTEVALEAGVAGVLDNQVASWFGTADESIGADAIHALGNLDGTVQGNANGHLGALGLRNTGRGGGGDSDKSIGLDDLASDGMKRGRRSGADKPDLGTHGGTTPGDVAWNPPVLVGGLDREIVQRVVRQHRGELKACYENELQKNKKLGGELVIKFTVTGKGDVISAVTVGGDFRHPMLEACITKRIRRWVFPEPRGGGIVVVRYPFRFSSGT